LAQIVFTSEICSETWA